MVSAPTLTALLLGSLAAGWVDAVVGGGGLILVPLILVLNPSFTTAQALSTNKVASLVGTTSSAITLGRRIPSARTALRFTPLALLGSALGAVLATSIDKAIMRPVIIVLLIAVALVVFFRPSFGQQTTHHQPTPARWLALGALVAAIGIYDGAFGPGTGLFLIMGYTALLGGDFLAGAAWAKVINVCTNLGALVTFALHGDVLWLLGLALAAANVIGSQVGARMVLGRGAGFVRTVLLVVVLVLTTKLALDHAGITG